MSPSVRRGFTWAVLVTATLVVIGVLLQVYFIAVFAVGGDIDGLDAHRDLGGPVHGIELLVLIAAIVAYWGRWRAIVPSLLLAVIGTLQLTFVETGGAWVRGLHGLLALVVLILAHAIVQRAVRDLGLGRHGATPAPPSQP